MVEPIPTIEEANKVVASPTTDSDLIAELAWHESVRGLEAQSRELDALHTRASFVLAATGVAAGALAQADRHGPFAIVSLLWFLVGGVLAVITFFPRWQAWKFNTNAKSVLDDYAEAGHTFRNTQWWLAGHNGDAYLENKGKLKDQYVLFFWACISVVLGICFAACDILVN